MGDGHSSRNDQGVASGALRMNLPARSFHVPNADGLEDVAGVVSKGTGLSLNMKLIELAREHYG